MAKKTIEQFNEKYWNVHPHLIGLVKVSKKFRKNGNTWVELIELSTGRTDVMRWCSALCTRQQGVPPHFDCHPHSLKNMNKTYLNARPHLRGLVKVSKKWCKKSPTGKSNQTYVELEEIETGKVGEIYWNQVLNPKLECVPPNFDCYGGNRNFPTNEKLCKFYFCKTEAYGNLNKWNDGPYLTIGVTTRDVKDRYISNGLLETYFEFETYDCLTIERYFLEQIVEAIGSPDAGWEAWQYTKEREDTILNILRSIKNLGIIYV